MSRDEQNCTACKDDRCPTHQVDILGYVTINGEERAAKQDSDGYIWAREKGRWMPVNFEIIAETFAGD